MVLENVLVSTQPVIPEKLETNENASPQKTIDYNSIVDEFIEQNDTIVIPTHLKTEPITTPEPSMHTHTHIFFYIYNICVNWQFDDKRQTQKFASQ